MTLINIPYIQITSCSSQVLIGNPLEISSIAEFQELY